jgi:hypothetical protein
MVWLLTSFPSVLCGSASGWIGPYGAWHPRRIERHRSPVFLRKEGHQVKVALLRHRRHCCATGGTVAPQAALLRHRRHCCATGRPAVDCRTIHALSAKLVGIERVVRVGVVYRVKISPPTRMMATSSGTCRPERWTVARQATAITSLAVRIAVGGNSLITSPHPAPENVGANVDDNVALNIIPRFVAHVNRFSTQNEIRHNLPLALASCSELVYNSGDRVKRGSNQREQCTG